MKKIIWNRSQIAFKRKMTKSTPQKSQIFITIQMDCFRAMHCNILFFFFIQFCVCKSAYISEIYILHQNFLRSYTHMNILIKIWIYSCIYINTWHSRDLLPQRISVLLPFFAILHALCFAQGFSSNSHPTCLCGCSWLPMRRPRKQLESTLITLHALLHYYQIRDSL